MTEADKLVSKEQIEYICNEVNEVAKYVLCSNDGHDWEAHGHGYKCTKCDFYTGTHSELNKLIRGV